MRGHKSCRDNPTRGADCGFFRGRCGNGIKRKVIIGVRLSVIALWGLAHGSKREVVVVVAQRHAAVAEHIQVLEVKHVYIHAVSVVQRVEHGDQFLGFFAHRGWVCLGHRPRCMLQQIKTYSSNMGRGGGMMC